MREDTKNKLVSYVIGDTENIVCMAYDSLVDEIEDFVDFVKEDKMGESMTETMLMGHSDETIARTYEEKVKDTAIHELTELYIKTELLAKALGYDIKAHAKAYMSYKKHHKK